MSPPPLHETPPRLDSHLRHVAELQSIRGIAALMVVIGHCISYYRTPNWWVFVKHLVNTQASVEIFFILSGYVLALSLSRRPIDRPALLAYYVKRLFRIYPALVFASLLALGYVAWAHYAIPVPGVSQWMSERFRADRFTPLHIVASFAGMLAFLIPPVWTIFVEIVASALLPGLAALLAGRHAPFWVAWAVLLAASLVLGGRLYYHIDMYLFDFALGASLLAIDPARLRRMKTAYLGWLVTVAALLFVCTRAFLWVDVWDRWMHLYEVLLGAFVIFAFARAGLVSAWLRSRGAIRLGDISYSIYLLHFTIMCVFAKAMAVLAPGLADAAGGIAAGLILAVLTVGAALWLAGWSYREVEKRGIAWGGAVIRRLDRGTMRRAEREECDAIR